MKLCSNVCNRCRLVCKILFKSEQICSCCCKMLRAHFFGTHGMSCTVSEILGLVLISQNFNRSSDHE